MKNKKVTNLIEIITKDDDMVEFEYGDKCDKIFIDFQNNVMSVEEFLKGFKTTLERLDKDELIERLMMSRRVDLQKDGFVVYRKDIDKFHREGDIDEILRK